MPERAATTVGAVLPARAPAPYLGEALDAVLAEGPAEVLVVDDESDPPLALDDRHRDRVRVIRRPTRGGPGAARNTGVEKLRPDVDVLAFCDADDVWAAGSLAPRLLALERDPSAALAFGRARIIGPDGRATGEDWPMPERSALSGVAALYASNPVLTSSVVMRRRAFSGFDATYAQAEDWELWLRLLAEGHTFVAVPAAEVLYRRHGGGLTADVLELAVSQQRMHAAYSGHVSDGLARMVAERDRAGIAEGLLRRRRFSEARALMAPGWRRLIAGVPALRHLLARRDPYRG